MLVRHRQQGPQTSKQAKAAYKKYGPRLSSQEARRLERGVELERRAEKIRETERRRKENKRRKLEKEERDRDTRRKMGIVEPGPRIRASQSQLMTFMKPKIVHGGEEDSKINDTTGGVLDAIIEENESEIHTQSQRGLLDEILEERKPVVEKGTLSQNPMDQNNPDTLEDLRLFSDSCFDIGSQTQRELVECSEITPTGDVMFEVDDFSSDTQIERELAREKTGSHLQPSLLRAEDSVVLGIEESLLEGISSQDIELSVEDLAEIGVT